jgi:hypothetical protein
MVAQLFLGGGLRLQALADELADLLLGHLAYW